MREGHILFIFFIIISQDFLDLIKMSLFLRTRLSLGDR